MLRRSLELFTALACAGPLAVQAQAPAQAPAAPTFNSVSNVYRCAGGVKLPVVYLNIQGGDAFATVYVNGTLALMRAGPTGSGANYYPVDERVAYRWQVKGDLGSLWYRAPGPASRETMLLQDCKIPRAP